MIRLKTLLEQANEASIRVAGKTITGKHITNTENLTDKWIYFKGDNNRYYTTLKAKQAWRDMKSSLSPANYKLATSRIESWGKVNPTTPTAETPADPNANIPSAVPSKGTTTYTAGKPSAQLAAQPDANQAPSAEDDDDNRPWSLNWKGLVHDDPEQNNTYSVDTDKTPRKWSTWKVAGYKTAPDQMPPSDNVKLIDSGILAVARSKSAAELILTRKLEKLGIDQSDNRIGIKVYNEIGDGTRGTEVKWITYSK